MRLKTFGKSDIEGKKVLVRVDFNVPLTADGKVADDTRINAHVPLIRGLQDAGARVALISHLGRPKGSPVAKYSLRPVAEELSAVLGKRVGFAEDCVGESAQGAADALLPGEVVLLENLRFHAEEERNDAAFAKALAAPFDVFIMDAFSAAHRAHASTGAVTDCLPSFAGPLLIREIEMLSAVRDDPKKPFALILGGAKVSDKIGVIENMLDSVDTIIIGGGMAFTFLKAQGLGIGKSLCEEDKLAFSLEMLRRAKAKGVAIVLPEDVTAASEISESASVTVVLASAIPADQMGLDIGPRAVESFCKALDGAKTVLWNGPMGVFEAAPFAKGTEAIAQQLAKVTKGGALTVVGGGDSAAAIAKFGHEKDVTHVSTGGGASLEFFEGKTLPGVEPYVIG
ncbi:MAG: phosphoglycerate kinase [Synergistaceae bacterium]|nr:phosphoglycerate kinase [Synergistaceae bacterium]